MTPLLLTFLTGCLADYTKPAVPPATSYSDLDLDETGASPAFPLAILPGDYDLPDYSGPEDSSKTEWVIPVQPAGDGKFSGRLPFSIGNPRGYPPGGVRVFVDDTEMTYADRGKKRWSGMDRSFEVEPISGTPSAVRVVWPELQVRLDRLNYVNSELTPEEFVKWSATVEGITRTGLMLPAPGAIEWEIAIPQASPKFQTWLTMHHTPLPDQESDGASAVLEIEAGGQTTEAGRKAISGSSEAFEAFDVDLSRWAGQTVTVRLKSDGGANDDYDFLFWGSPTIWGAPDGDVRRVIVIGIDTTRPDHLGFYGYDKPTSPELDAIARNAIVFDNAWTPAPRTRPSFRSATTGREPLDAVGAKTIAQVFQEHGFATGGVVANVHLQPRFGFHEGYDRWLYDNGAKAEDQVDRALAYLNDNLDRDTYLFMHLLDPHIFYGAPGRWRNKFVTARSDLPDRINRWAVYRKMAKNELSEEDKQYLEQLYDGEIAYTSYQLGRFFNQVDQLPGKTLVIIHSDHGEEFWEHGGFEHNHTLYTDTTKALFVVRPGSGFEGGMRIDTPVTLKDIAPTLFDYAGFEPDSLPPLDGKSVRPLVEGTAEAADYQRPLGIGHLRYGRERWAVVHEDHKYVLHTASGREEFYNLASDPGEQTDLIDTDPPLNQWRRALADAHSMPVCDGLRFYVNAPRRGEVFSVELPVAPKGVEILDPERTVEKPANQAWGLKPTRVPEEIGEIRWEPGSTRFTWKPGTNPTDGVIFAFFDQAPDPAQVKVFHGASVDPLPFKKTATGLVWGSPGKRLEIRNGVVVSPPPGEATRMRALKLLAAGAAGGEDLEMLEELGYIGGDEDDAPEPEPEPEPEAEVPDDQPRPEGSDETGDSGAAPAAPDALTAQACRW